MNKFLFYAYLIILSSISSSAKAITITNNSTQTLYTAYNATRNNTTELLMSDGFQFIGLSKIEPHQSITINNDQIVNKIMAAMRDARIIIAKNLRLWASEKHYNLYTKLSVSCKPFLDELTIHSKLDDITNKIDANYTLSISGDDKSGYMVHCEESL